MFQGNFEGVIKEVHGCYRGVLWVLLQRCFMGVLKYFKGGFRWFMGVSRAFDAHSNVVLSMICECFIAV